MSFTLLIGNNFITNSPKAVKFNDRYLFKLDQPSNSEIPLISIVILDKNGNRLLVVESNQVKECSPELTQKKSYKEHVFVVDKSGEIIFESRILDKKTIIVSGIFHVDNLKLTITQNYIILPTEKWIMHDRINSYNKEVSIDTEGIKVLQ